MHVVDGRLRHISQICEKCHGAPSEAVLDVGVAGTTTVEDDGGANSEGVAGIVEACFFEIAVVCDLCHFPEEFGNHGGVEEAGSLALFKGSVGRGRLVTLKAKSFCSLLDALDSADAAKSGLGVVGCLGDFFPVMSILLESDGDYSAAELGFWVGCVFFIGEPFSVGAKKLEVIQEALVDVLACIFAASDIFGCGGGFVARPFASAVSHVEPHCTPVNKSILFGVGVCAGCHDISQGGKHFLGEWVFAVWYLFPAFELVELTCDFAVFFSGEWVFFRACLPEAHRLDVGRSSAKVSFDGGCFDRASLDSVSSR